MKTHVSLMTALGCLFFNIDLFALNGPPPPVPQEASSKAYREAYNQMLDERWQEAAKSFNQLLRDFPQSDWADDATFWLCYIQEKSEGNLENVFDCFNRFVEAHERSEWSNDAKRNLVRIAHQLAKEGKPEYEQMVKSLGRNEDTEIMLTALAALSDIGDETSVQTIIEKFDGSANDEVRAKIARILEDHAEKPMVWNKLTQIARTDSSPQVRRSAVKALAEHKTPESLSILKELAANDRDPEVRKTAIRELGDLRKPETLPFLLNLALNEPDLELAEAAVYAIGDIRGKDSLDMLQRIYRESNRPKVRRAVMRAIGGRDQDRITMLSFLRQAALNDAEPEVRSAAVSSLGQLQTVEALEALKELAVADLDLKTRASALRAIREFPAEVAVPALKAVLIQIQDARLRSYTMEILGDTRSDAAIPILIDAARNDPNAKVKQEAVRALGEIGSAKAREAIIGYMQEQKKEN